MAEVITTAALAMESMVVGEERAKQEIRRWTATGIFILLATVGVGSTWSALAPLSSAVLAQGAIKVDSSRKKIQHSEGGVVKEILVRDGSQVREGDVLVRLDATRAGAAHGVVTGGRDVALAAQARLQAERDDRPAIQFPPELMRRASVDQVRQTIRSQEQIFLARRDARIGELRILEQQVQALQSEIVGLRAQQASKQQQIESLGKDQVAYADLDKEGFIDQTRLRGVERDIVRLQGERDELESKMAAARTAIGERELKKLQVRKSFQEEVAAELKKVQAENFELIEREGATKRTLELTELRAPVTGTITDLKVHTAAGVVGPGEVLMELVPTADSLVVEARVLPQDIDRVSVGQGAGVKLHAFNARTTPELEATVSYVSADAVVDPRTEIAYFIVKMTIPQQELARLGGKKLHAGMQTDVFIRTGERTFIGYLMEPLSDSFRKAWRER